MLCSKEGVFTSTSNSSYHIETRLLVVVVGVAVAENMWSMVLTRVY